MADTGTWRFPDGGNTPKVTSAAAEGGFAAYEGSQYLTFVRTGPDADRAMARDATTSGAGQKTTVRFAFRNVSGLGLQVQSKKDDGSQHGGNDMGVAVYVDGPGSATPNHVRWYDGSAKDTGLVSDPNKWNTLVWSHTDGVAGYTVSLNGSAPVAITEAKAVIWNLTYMASMGIGTTYIDAFAFPEPSSLVVLLGAMTGLLAYAWRKRT